MKKIIVILFSILFSIALVGKEENLKDKSICIPPEAVSLVNPQSVIQNPISFKLNLQKEIKQRLDLSRIPYQEGFSESCFLFLVIEITLIDTKGEFIIYSHRLVCYTTLEPIFPYQIAVWDLNLIGNKLKNSAFQERLTSGIKESLDAFALDWIKVNP